MRKHRNNVMRNKIHEAMTQSQLHHLTTVSNVFTPVLQEDSELIEQILMIFLDRQERNAHDIQVILKGKARFHEIDSSLKILYKEGKLKHRWKKPEGFVYSVSDTAIADVITPSALKVEPKVEVSKEPTYTEPIDKYLEYRIKGAEGINVCIWKMMEDHHPRKLATMYKFLEEIGFDRKFAKDRILKLTMEGWFVVAGKKGDATYRMKNEIQKPTGPVPEEDIPTTPANAPAAVVTKQEGETAVLDIGPTKVQINTASEEVPEVKDPLENVYGVVKGDAIDQAIWKMTSLGLPTDPADAAELLEKFGFKKPSVATRFGVLFKKGWFTREPIPGSRSFTYTLVPGFKYNQEVKEEQVTKVIPPVDTPKREFVESELLSFQAKIKGMTFTFKQAEKMAQELKAGGYGQGRVNPNQSEFVKTDRRIRDTPFTEVELEELAVSLFAAGFGEEETVE